MARGKWQGMIHEQGLFTIYERFAENPVGEYLEHDFLSRSCGKVPGATEHLKRRPVFPNGIFQTEIRVPFFQSHLCYQFQDFAVVFR